MQLRVSRRNLERLTLLCGSLLLCELMVRLLGYSPHGGAVHQGVKPLVEKHQILGWQLAPGMHKYEYSLDGTEIPVSVTSYNSRTASSSDNPITAPADSARALFFLGDSFTFGSGLFDQETVPWIVGEKLNVPVASNLTVYNFGTIGHSTCQSYLRMKMLNDNRTENGVTSGAIFIYGFSAFHERRNIAHPGQLWRIARASTTNSAYIPWCDIDKEGNLILHEPELFTLPAAFFFDHLALGSLIADAYFHWQGRDRVRREKSITRTIIQKMKLEAESNDNQFIVFLQRLSPTQQSEYVSFFSQEKIAFITGEQLPKDMPGVLAADQQHPGPVQAARWAEQIADYLEQGH